MGRTFRRESRKFQEDFDTEIPQEILDDYEELVTNHRRTRNAKHQSRLQHDDAYASAYLNAEDAPVEDIPE